MASRGYSAKRIAGALFLSEQTVKNHLSNSYRKLGIHSKQSLISLVDSYR
jgi:DNA-binding CsgD family transcriptional regulator